MNLEKTFILEEDLFPKLITNYQERPYGILFYNESNKISYDSNHAVIYKDQIEHLEKVLEDIINFYQSKSIHPSIYQATQDEGYFEEHKHVFNKMGFKVWTERPAKFMVLEGDNEIDVSKSLTIKLINEWDERIASDICIPSAEAYEIEVFKNAINHKAAKVFVGFKDDEAKVILSMHESDLGCVRFDYILVSKNERKHGYGKEMISYVTEYCKQHKLENCYLWPAHEVSERISHQAGFRYIFTKEVARASYTKYET